MAVLLQELFSLTPFPRLEEPEQRPRSFAQASGLIGVGSSGRWQTERSSYCK